jgi:hypothetical protein
MTIAAIREKLHNYISEADDEKVKNLYNIFEDQMAPAYEWSKDAEFVAELEDRVKRWENGTAPGFSIDEVKASLEELKKERSQRSSE